MQTSTLRACKSSNTLTSIKVNRWTLMHTCDKQKKQKKRTLSSMRETEMHWCRRRETEASVASFASSTLFKQDRTLFNRPGMTTHHCRLHGSPADTANRQSAFSEHWSHDWHHKQSWCQNMALQELQKKKKDDYILNWGGATDQNTFNPTHAAIQLEMTNKTTKCWPQQICEDCK